MSRKRGRIVLVGVVGLDLQRADFYEKELSFQVACSYGPGRYDPPYEAGGARLSAALRALDRGAQLRGGARRAGARRARRAAADLAARALSAMRRARVRRDPERSAAALGVVLDVPAERRRHRRRWCGCARAGRPASAPAAAPVVGVIGAGEFARQVLLPAIAAAGADVALGRQRRRRDQPARGAHVRRRRGDDRLPRHPARRRRSTPSSSPPATTRTRAWSARRSPPASTSSSRSRWRSTRTGSSSCARAHAEHPRPAAHGRLQPPLRAARRAPRARCWPDAREPLALRDHGQRRRGARRPLGATTRRSAAAASSARRCHFIDLALFLVGQPDHRGAGDRRWTRGTPRGDTMSIDLAFADGSIATIHYWANGPRSYPKERVEIFSDGRVADDRELARAARLRLARRAAHADATGQGPPRADRAVPRTASRPAARR